jgi:nitroreductase
MRYKKYYSPERKNSKNKKELSYWILQDKHRIEKALSLPKPRESFGEVVISRLTRNLCEYRKLSNHDRVYSLGISALGLYKKFHQDNNYPIPSFFEKYIVVLNSKDFIESFTLDVGVHSKKIEDTSLSAFDEFVHSRSSCRNFIPDKKLSKTQLENVIRNSIKTPSVCNRQHWKIHVFSGENKDNILKLQNGNAGFGHTAPYIALITSELSAFYTANERNQPFIDGGMFAMSFIYSLHSESIASCPLNWCTSYFSERHLRKLNLIPNSEVIIMAIAFGFPNENTVYANSPKFDLNEFYTLDW